MAELPVLDPVDTRVLGALLEKERTVPASYPLSLTALRTACNQTSSREPVTDHDDATLEATARSLKERGLLRIVWAGTGARTLKYHQLVADVLDIDDAERAVMTVLLLRGPQSPGELTTRTRRLHGFADRAEVEATLARMAAREAPLVARLERQAGHHDARWAHLLGPVAAQTASPSPPAIDLDVPLHAGPQARDARVVQVYEALAAELVTSGDRHPPAAPLERWLLERVAASAEGPILDVGCGTGEVAGFLADAGASVHGVDVSPALIDLARSAHPGVTFEVADLRRVLRPPTAAGWGAVVAWDVLVHFGSSELSDVVAGPARVLARGGQLALSTPVGGRVEHPGRAWGRPVDLEWVRHDAASVRDAVTRAGLSIIEWYVCGPRPDDGGERLHVLARRP